MIKDPHLSLCFYPTTVGLIDDNTVYLKQLFLRLTGREKLPCFIYEDPQKALQFLVKQPSNPFLNLCLINQEDNPFDHLIVDLDIRAIHRTICNSRRFSEITTLVVDYAMPGLNGLELCRKLRGSLKIIMLTGEAGKDLAIEAFNEGSIDKFILKNTPNLMEVLVKNIRELQMDYFLNLSEIALNKIADFSKHNLSCLSDPIFVEFFKNLCVSNKIVEYYLMDAQGSFLLLDAMGKPSVLAVGDEELLSTYQELAQDDHAASFIVNSLKNREKMPYFHTQKDFETYPANWSNYLHPIQILEGNKKYYYAYISNCDLYDMEAEKIVSYKNHLEPLIEQLIL